LDIFANPARRRALRRREETLMTDRTADATRWGLIVVLTLVLAGVLAFCYVFYRGLLLG
jgi:hypothetical protein